MSLFERIQLESQQMDKLDFHQKNCFNCKYWVHKVKKESKFCHKCINNLDIPLSKEGEGYNLEGLRDYFLSAKESKAKEPNV